MKKLIIVLSIFSLFSCKTTRQTISRSETRQENTTADIEQTAREQTAKTVNVAERITDAENAVITEKETVFSTPDSSGRQHPEKITERRIEVAKKREQDKTTATESVTTATKNETHSAEIRTVTETNESLKTKQKQRWPWQVTVGIAALAVVAFIIIRNRLKWKFK